MTLTPLAELKTLQLIVTRHRKTRWCKTSIANYHDKSCNFAYKSHFQSTLPGVFVYKLSLLFPVTTPTCDSSVSKLSSLLDPLFDSPLNFWSRRKGKDVQSFIHIFVGSRLVTDLIWCYKIVFGHWWQFKYSPCITYTVPEEWEDMITNTGWSNKNGTPVLFLR